MIKFSCHAGHWNKLILQHLNSPHPKLKTEWRRSASKNGQSVFRAEGSFSAARSYDGCVNAAAPAIGRIEIKEE